MLVLCQLFLCGSVIVQNYTFLSFFLFQVSVYLQNWSHVLSYVNKAESTPEAEVSYEYECCSLSLLIC